jgi:cytochrome c oxidase assembly protein subunit 15
MSAAPAETSRPINPAAIWPVAIWLLAVCGMIWVMIVLGGATRLTGSGLSITEWDPLMGALPPLSHAEWERLFHQYQHIPQYRLVNDGFGLAGFKHIFWLEWSHRLWGRLIGLVFLLPLLWFAWRRQISHRLLPRLVLFFVLGAMQGVLGWLMVKSGFVDDRTSVSAYWLVAHLTLALTLFGAVLWTALDLLACPSPHAAQRSNLRRGSLIVCILAAFTIMAGGFTAGNHAGLVYNTFPLMDGHWIPPHYWAIPSLRNFFENIPAVQFDHRLLATLTLIAALTTVAAGLRDRVARRWSAALGAAIIVQYGLGIATLLWVVPIPAAVAHQAVAVAVLASALGLQHRLRH